MENVTEEKSLVKIDNSIFARVRKFLTNIFKKKDYNKSETVDNIEGIESAESAKTVENIKSTEEENKVDELAENSNQNAAKTQPDYEGKEELEKKLMNYYASIKTSLKQ